MESKTQEGYLVLADISGFTSYLAQVELDHAHEILTDLLEAIVTPMKGVLTISKLEGDAVFAYSSGISNVSGETILDLLEHTYGAFRHQRDIAHRNTTCECGACRAIPTLDLKFFVHRGKFIVQEVAGTRELVGSDVNLAHRLMKNHVTEATGWKAYALLTEACLTQCETRPESMHAQTETYEHLGTTLTFSFDLHPRYTAFLDARHVEITPSEADWSHAFDFPAPPPVVWEWLTDNRRRTLAGGGGMKFTALARPGGRMGPGTRNHCAHGAGMKNTVIETVLDWHPFEYCTMSSLENDKNAWTVTYRLTPLENGQKTHVNMYMQMKMPMPGFMRRLMMRMMFARENPYETYFQSIAKGIEAEREQQAVAA